MALLTDYILLDVFFIFSCGFLYLYIQAKKKYKYWKKKNVTQPDPTFPWGNCQGIGRTTCIGRILTKLYEKYKKEKFIGIYVFWKPFWVVNDLDLVKNVFVKDFNHFHDRGFRLDEELEPLSAHLFSMNGQEWRNLRIKLTPTFTSGKMKMMFPIMVNVGEEMKKVLDEPASGDGIIEVKDILARYTTDVISSCAFGLDVSSLKNPDSEFRRIYISFTKPTVIQKFARLLIVTAPKILSFFKMRVIPKSVTEFFINTVKDTMNYREENNVKRNDFMDLLIQLKNKGYIEDADANKTGTEISGPVQKFTIEQAAAQAFIFLFAGQETSSTTMQFALYELSLNPDLQKVARNEIDQVMSRHKGNITYEGIQEMEYLDRVVSETLRKYPPATSIIRECTKDYVIPGTDITIEKNTIVLIPVKGIHYDPDIYPNPEKFDPDRFLQEEKEKRDHYAYLPFGEGPRICIGMRFGLLETKLGLAILLSNYEFEVCEKTPIPIKLDPKIDFLVPIGGIHLRIKKRMISEL